MVEESSRSAGRRRRQESAAGDADELRPLDVDGVGTVLVGIVIWALALAGTLIFYDTLREQGRDWWVWTCLAGLGLGLIGFEYSRRRRARQRLRDSQPAEGTAGKRARRPESDEDQT